MSDDKQIVLEHKHLIGEDFSGRELSLFRAIGSRLENCRFDRARIENAQFGSGHKMSEYIDCSFDGASLRMAPAGNARYIGCSFNNVVLQDWHCYAVELIDCSFSGELRRGIFNGTVPDEDRTWVGRERNAFHGNDFSAMELRDVGFRTGIDLTQQKLPSGSDYLYVADAHFALARASSDIVGWQDLEMRKDALLMMQALQLAAKDQLQLLLRTDNYAAYSGKVVDRVFALLGGDRS